MDYLKIKLTPKEETILLVLWDAKEPLTVKEICKHAENMNVSLNQSTVQASINKLVNVGLLRVNEIKQTATNFVRTFVAVIDSEEYSIIKARQIFSSVSKHKRANFIAALINDDEFSDSDYEELKLMVERLKH